MAKVKTHIQVIEILTKVLWLYGGPWLHPIVALQNVLGDPDGEVAACANNTKPSSHDGAPCTWGH